MIYIISYIHSSFIKNHKMVLISGLKTTQLPAHSHDNRSSIVFVDEIKPVTIYARPAWYNAVKQQWPTTGWRKNRSNANFTGPLSQYWGNNLGSRPANKGHNEWVENTSTQRATNTYQLFIIIEKNPPSFVKIGVNTTARHKYMPGHGVVDFV